MTADVDAMDLEAKVEEMFRAVATNPRGEFPRAEAMRAAAPDGGRR
jgi:hypothetical protein